MFKSTMLNSDICQVLSKLGHTDQIVIGDAGLPIPDHIQRIDLAITHGLPKFIDVLREVLKVMQVEKIILANEIKEQNLAVYNEIVALVKQYSNKAEIAFCYHEVFKKHTTESQCKAIIRTGECTPYANIILESGVVF